jgi:opacity protein-like surface antigen
MASKISRARATALTALVGAMIGQSALAADMPFMSASPIVDQPVEFGSGWYLRGDVGYSNTEVPVIIADFANLLGRKGSVSGGLGIGYQYNSWLRTDFTLDRTVFRPGRVGTPFLCPSGTVAYWAANGIGPSGQIAVAGQPAGYLLDPTTTCSPVFTSSLDRWTPMANVYFDLGHWNGLTPYVGGGIGLRYVTSAVSESIVQNWNGQLWAPNLGQGNGIPWVFVDHNGAFAPYLGPPITWGQQVAYGLSYKKKSWGFAWNLMAGASYDVSQNLKVDVSYRFLNSGRYTGFAGFLNNGIPVSKDMVTQEVRVGFRLTTD